MQVDSTVLAIIDVALLCISHRTAIHRPILIKVVVDELAQKLLKINDLPRPWLPGPQLRFRAVQEAAGSHDRCELRTVVIVNCLKSNYSTQT